MTLLYRTPNLVVEDLEFHATVETTRSGSAKRHFRVRRQGEVWMPLSAYPGNLPKGKVLGSKFAPFRRHMLQAARGRVLLPAKKVRK